MTNIYENIGFLNRGVALINKLDATIVKNLSDRILSKVPSASHCESPLGESDIEKLSASLELAISEGELLVKTITSIFLRAAYYSLKASSFQGSLQLIENLSEDARSSLVAAWEANHSVVTSSLKRDVVFPCQLDDVNWQLGVTLSQTVQKRSKVPNAIFTFHTSDTTSSHGNGGTGRLDVEMDEEMLLKLFKSLDTIQRNLDSLSQ